MCYTFSSVTLHLGLLDCSAGVALSNDSFVGASDEINMLHSHSTLTRQLPKLVLNLNEHTDWFPAKLDKDEPEKFHEADLEGAAQVGDVVYWISSHACAPEKKKKDGTIKPVEQREERQVFFATRLETSNGTIKLVPTGKVYQNLLIDLIDEPSLKKFGLVTASKLAPKDGPTKGNPDRPPGLNIESLCAAKDGGTLLIGFRNPIPDGKALLVPLTNPAEVVADKAKAKLGVPIQLDLGGLGFRDMVWWKDAYLIIGGDFGDRFDDAESRPSRLFRWGGLADDAPQALETYPAGALDALNPEALIAFPDGRVLILSDDGALKVLPDGTISDKGKKQKDLPERVRFFRSVWLENKV